MSCSCDKSIAFMKAEQRKILKKIEYFSNSVQGIKFIWLLEIVD